MKTSKRLLLLIAPVLLSLTLISSHVSASFTDVKADHPQYDAITYLEEMDIVEGYDDGTFRPDKPVNKAGFFKILFNHIGYKPFEAFYETPFEDVGSGYWFAPYVKKALELNIIMFNPADPLFLPGDPLTRIEASKLIMPLEGVSVPYIANDTTTVFQDIEPDFAGFHFVKAAENSGIFIVEDEPLFKPFENLTRGDTAELLYKSKIYRENQGGLVMTTMEIVDSLEGFDANEKELINNPKFPILLSVWSKINEDYLNADKINQNELVYGAIEGMVDALQDPYSVFEEPEQAENTWDSLEGSYEGIGTIIDTYEGQFIIIGVMHDSPAENAGLKTGDIILNIDGQTFDDTQINKLIDAIKGPSGTKVEITIDRDGEIFTFEVTRQQITLDTVLLEASTNSTTVPASIGYIAIYQFTDSTSQEFDKIVTETLASNPKGLIIDLRDNPGGYVDSALDILGYFIPEGEVIAKLEINNRVLEEKSTGSAMLKDIPTIILVNENTASAAEIVAGALQDHDQATLIGKKTYGKGTVQEVNIYTDGSLFKLSIAKWLTPNGTDIDHIGLTPDIIIEPTKEDIVGTTDSQLQKAIDRLDN